MEYMNERTVALTKPPKADKQPSEHLKKCAKEIINHLLGLANKLNKEDRAVYKYIEKLNGSMNLVYDSSYNENGIPIEVSGVIDPDKKADDIAEAALKSNGFTKLTMAKGNSNVYYKSFSETSKVIAIVNGQKGGLLRSYSLINLYTSSSLTESTIFEGVQFLGSINEEYASGGALIRIANKLGLRKLAARTLANKSYSDPKAVKKAMYNFSLAFDNVKKFNEAIDTVKDISIKELSKIVKVDIDKDLEGTDAHSSAIFDSNNSVMAYEIRDTYANYYKIFTTKFKIDKNLETFVKAVFEDHLHLVGEGLTEILRSKNEKYAFVNGYNKERPSANNPKEYTKEEFDKILAEMKSMANKISSFLNKISKKYKLQDEFDVGDNFDKTFPIGKIIDGFNDGPEFTINWEYDETKDGFEDMIDELSRYVFDVMEASNFYNDIYYNDNFAHEYFKMNFQARNFIIVDKK